MSAWLALALLLTSGDSLRFTPADVSRLPAATTLVEREAGRLVIELPAIEVPAEGMIRTPVYRAQVPFTASVHGFHVEVMDQRGMLLPPDRLHHFNLTDPARRELFAPLPLHIVAASKETPAPTVPKYAIGMPLPAGDRFIAAAMLANPEPMARRLRARLVLDVIPLGRVLPLIRAYPWVMDVMFPLGGEGGRKDFDLPPGPSSHSWESSPAVAGTILGLGGHVHDYATAIELRDVTDGKTIWHQEPVRDRAGRVIALPVGRFYRWYRLGVRITPAHRYRVTVYYDNPTGETIPYGGMGVVAGLFTPKWGWGGGTRWPGVDAGDPIYLAYVDNLLRNMEGLEMGHGQHQHH